MSGCWSPIFGVCILDVFVGLNEIVLDFLFFVVILEFADHVVDCDQIVVYTQIQLQFLIEVHRFEVVQASRGAHN